MCLFDFLMLVGMIGAGYYGGRSLAVYLGLRRGKRIIGIVGVLVLLVCGAAVKVHRIAMHRPDVYLTPQRTAELAAFAEQLLKERDRTSLELISVPWRLPTSVNKADPPLTDDQVRSMEKVLRKNHLHRIALDRHPSTVTYGYYALHVWCFYIYVSDPGVVPPKGPCRTIRKVRDHWYFGMF